MIDLDMRLWNVSAIFSLRQYLNDLLVWVM
jgi:hypothetical protein